MSSDQDSCYLCKEYLRDPVSIPCGHVFCSICLKTYWDHADHTGSFLCPQCRVSYSKRPTPRRMAGSRHSTNQRNSEAFPPPPPSPDYNYAGPQDVGCDISSLPLSKGTSWWMRLATWTGRSVPSIRRVWSCSVARTRCASVCSMFLAQNSAQRALQECEKMFSDMMRSIERMQQEMAKLISSNKRAALNNAEGHLERLSHEIADLYSPESMLPLVEKHV